MDGNTHLQLMIGDLAFRLAAAEGQIDELSLQLQQKDLELQKALKPVVSPIGESAEPVKEENLCQKK